MNEKPRAYIAGIGMISLLGWNVDSYYRAVRAGINAYQSVDYFTVQRECMHMALVPDSALPPLVDGLNLRGKLSFRYRRILSMSHAAATQAMAGFKGDALDPNRKGCDLRLERMGWLPCDGREVAIAKYPFLFRSIGHIYGKGSSDGFFLLPDYRGRFLRGVSSGARESSSSSCVPGELRDPDADEREASGEGGIKLAPCNVMPYKVINISMIRLYH